MKDYTNRFNEVYSELQKAIKNYSHLTKVPVTDKNGHVRMVYKNMNKDKKSTNNKPKEFDINSLEKKSNGLGGSPLLGETGIRWSDSDMDDGELVIDNVFVANKDRRKGIGKKLVMAAINHAREKGYKQVGIYAEPQTDDAMDSGDLINWYRDIGFESDPDADELMTYKL